MSTEFRRFRVGALGALALSVFLCGSARADAISDGSAKDAYQRGAQAYAKHQYPTAAAAFEEGYKLKPHPAFLFNLALTYRALDKPQQAIGYYERYLEMLPDAPDRGQVETAIADEKRKLASLDKDRDKEKATPAPASAAQGTALPEAAVATTVPATGTGRDSGSSERTPIYRKWWFWAATGGAAVVAAVGLGVGLGVGMKPGVAPYREVTWQ